MAASYRPLRDYALVGDLRTAALVASDGSIDWWCAPRFDSPAVLCRLLDAAQGGYLRLGPEGAFEATSRYLGDTNVLATDFALARGRVRLTDFMGVVDSPGETRRMDSAPRLLRLVEGLDGVCGLELRFRPTFDYARAHAPLALVRGGVVASTGNESLALACPASSAWRVEPSGEASATLRVRAGERVWLTLTHTTGEPPPVGLDVAELDDTLERTKENWSGWARRIDYAGPFRASVVRSALVLKLLTYGPTGALVAAPTTSLPEGIGGVRNWDYRYTWLRDSAWMLDALMRLGHHDEAMSFWDWMHALALDEPGELRIMYAVDGTHPPVEQELAHLDGYRGSRPVRIGNAAAGQTQLDVFGEVLDALFLCSECMPEMRPLEPRLKALVTFLAEEAAARCGGAGQGLWEQRTEPRRIVTSLVYNWVALDRAIRIAERDGWERPVDPWRRRRDELRRLVLEEGYDASIGAFTQSLGDRQLDASALLLPLVGFLPATDPRFASTLEAIRRQLETDGLVRRYLADDGLAGGEGAFTACSFWLASGLALAGRVDEAREVFERVLSHASSVGLLAEEIDPSSGELLGNYPQGFTHLALIRAAHDLARAER